MLLHCVQVDAQQITRQRGKFKHNRDPDLARVQAHAITCTEPHMRRRGPPHCSAKAASHWNKMPWRMRPAPYVGDVRFTLMSSGARALPSAVVGCASGARYVLARKVMPYLNPPGVGAGAKTCNSPSLPASVSTPSTAVGTAQNMSGFRDAGCQSSICCRWAQPSITDTHIARGSVSIESRGAAARCTNAPDRRHCLIVSARDDLKFVWHITTGH